MDEFNETGNILFRHLLIARLIFHILIWMTGIAILFFFFFSNRLILFPIAFCLIILSLLGFRKIIREYYDKLEK